MLERMKLPLTFILALSGCATEPSIPVPKQESAGIGLSVRAIMGTFPGTLEADVVYFSKRCAPSESCDNRIYVSNYVKDGRIYWLDAPPGEYVAVATSLQLSNDKHIVYFPEEITRKTLVHVEVGRFFYLGDYTFDTSLGVCPDKADASQMHYVELFAPGTAKCGLLNITGEKFVSTLAIFMGKSVRLSDTHYRGTIRQFRQDDTQVREFVSRAKEDLRGTGWESLLERAEAAQK